MNDMSAITLGDERDHYWLAVSMAKAAGIDLVAAVEAGGLTHEGWADVVQRCRGCAWEREGGGCSRWLEAQEAGMADVPHSCVNHNIFEGLEGYRAARDL
ncbi:MAG: DUF6455 family protein [Pseudomonadota bacterium]